MSFLAFVNGGRLKNNLSYCHTYIMYTFISFWVVEFMETSYTSLINILWFSIFKMFIDFTVRGWIQFNDITEHKVFTYE